MFQLLHDRLDDALIYAIEEGNFSICCFDRADAGGFVGRIRGSYRFLFSESSVTGTIVKFLLWHKKAPP